KHQQRRRGFAENGCPPGRGQIVVEQMAAAQNKDDLPVSPPGEIINHRLAVQKKIGAGEQFSGRKNRGSLPIADETAILKKFLCQRIRKIPEKGKLSDILGMKFHNTS